MANGIAGDINLTPERLAAYRAEICKAMSLQYDSTYLPRAVLDPIIERIADEQRKEDALICKALCDQMGWRGTGSTVEIWTDECAAAIQAGRKE